MPTLEGFDGRSLVPNITGTLRGVGQGLMGVRALGRDMQADQLAEQANSGDVDALAMLGRFDPQAAQHIGGILEAKDAKAAAEARGLVENRARLMAGYLQAAEQGDNMAMNYLVNEAQRRQQAGEPIDDLVQFSQLPGDRRNLMAQRDLLEAQTIEGILKQMFPPVGDIVKQQMGAGAIVEIDGKQYFSNPVFDPATGSSKTNLTPLGGGNPIEVETSTLDGMASAGRAKIVSKTSGLTPEQQVEQQQSEAAAKERGKRSSVSLRSYMDEGLVAADAMGSVTRALSLLDEVGTGGVTSTAGLRIKQMFGVESADEGELSGLMGKAVLSQLRSTFGAAFTEREGARLENIEAGFGKNTETNRRLLQNAMSVMERAAERGIKAAEQEGDNFTADQIRESMEQARAALKKDAENVSSPAATPEQPGGVRFLGFE